MEYTKQDVLRINKDFENMNNFLYRKIKDICETICFFDKNWNYEYHEICDDYIHVVAFDVYYDLHDTKSMNIPLDWIFDSNWKVKWQEQEEKKREEEQKQEEIKKKEKEIKEYHEYLRLSEKFKDKEVKTCNS